MPKSVLIVSYSPLHTDPRVRRQVFALADEYAITTAGFTDPQLPDIAFMRLHSEPVGAIARAKRWFWLILRRYDRYYWSAAKQKDLALIRSAPCDVVIANDLNALPLCLALPDKPPVYCDLHEFSPAQFGDRRLWRWFYSPYYSYLAAKYLTKATVLSTVCDGIADEYSRAFRAPRPHVLTNAPRCDDDLPPTRPTVGSIRMIHHGVAASGRRLELMIEMMDYLDTRFSLDLMLVHDKTEYFETLVRKARGKRVRFLDPVATEDITRFINGYDIGVYLLAPTNLNQQFALPNKFFEFLQAKLAIAIGPSPEMAAIVRKEQIGVVAADFTPRALAEALGRLSEEQIWQFKCAASRVADKYSFRHNRQLLRDLVAGAIGR